MSEAVQAPGDFVERMLGADPVRLDGEPAWVLKLRERGLSRFRALGLPTTRNEAWKYTSLDRVTKTPYGPAPRVAASDVPLFGWDGTDAFRIVLVNGHVDAGLSVVDGLPDGTIVASLAETLGRDPDALKEHLGAHAEVEDRALTALNTARFTDGAFIHIPDQVILEKPIVIIHIAAGRDKVVSSPRNVVRLGRNAQATLIEAYEGGADVNVFTNAVTEIGLGEGAVLDHTTLNEEPESTVHIATLAVDQARSASFTHHNFCLGAGLTRNDVIVRFDGEGGTATLDGLFMTEGSQHVDNHTYVDHRSPHCTSRQLYKGILDGKSRGVFHGKVDIRKDAQRSDADQHNPNLILSKGALVDSTPALEINADDVKATHGSTIGRLDSTALFYLRSRGIDEATARSLLIYGFAKQIIDRVPNEALKARLAGLVLKRLPGGPDAKEVLDGPVG